MGLDMYAFTLRQDLAPAEDVDISHSEIVLRHVAGDAFWQQLVDSEQIPPNDPRHAELKAKRREFMQQATAEGLINTDFAYWRKFNHLHGWMEKLYRKKGGQAESFNLCTVRLREEDLKQLLEEASGLTPTPGFFFGSYESMTPEDVQEVVAFAARALQAIADGYAVYYDSWW